MGRINFDSLVRKAHLCLTVRNICTERDGEQRLLANTCMDNLASPRAMRFDIILNAYLSVLKNGRRPGVCHKGVVAIIQFDLILLIIFLLGSSKMLHVTASVHHERELKWSSA